MKQKKNIPFKITSIDSLGQGVSKETDKITFIPKTLPNETGSAEVVEEKKGVAFARLLKIDQKSIDRVPPLCPHFDICPSCHFQHTTYEKELTFKQHALEKLFSKAQHPPVEITPAPRRYEYRNRVQLHYNKKARQLGMLHAQTGTILPIPQCIITLPQIKKEVDRLYSNENWFKEANGPTQGHVEIYFNEDELKVTWNKNYAHGGFTQVFNEMNLKLKSTIREHLENKQTKTLDLFAGNGNLSNDINSHQRLCVDIYPFVGKKNEFYSQNLYEPEALKNVQSQIKQASLEINHLLLDPPRSGLKNLNEWVQTLRPELITYVSCDPHTLARDIVSLGEYEIHRLVLLDFFPATFHFESLIFLHRK